MLPQGMLIDKKKYPRYTGRNSLSARLNSEHSDRLSFPRNFDNPIERNDNKTGIKNNEISNIQLGKLKMLKSSFIKYKIIIHEVAFIVNKNLNNKFILQSPSVRSLEIRFFLNIHFLLSNLCFFLLQSCCIAVFPLSV